MPHRPGVQARNLRCLAMAYCELRKSVDEFMRTLGEQLQRHFESGDSLLCQEL